MAVIIRGTKTSAGGGTAFTTGSVIQADEVNTDFDTAYSEINGNLDNDNLDAAADVALTKLADISATAATHDDTTTPGDSSSHTLPTTLSGEIQQLRYTIERLALGIGADRVDGTGTGTTFWGDLPARGPNHIKNPAFAAGDAAATTTPPYGWVDIGTGTPTFTSVNLAGAHLSEGGGREVRIQAGSAAVAGIKQILSDLKASTRYLVVARARATTNAAHLTVTGADATSSFRNIDDTSSSSSYVTLKGVIQTDSTPTDVVIKLTTNGGNGDDVRFAFCGVYECGADHVELGDLPPVVDTSSVDVAISNVGFTDLGVSAESRVPGPGYYSIVTAQIPLVRNTNDCVVGIQILEAFDGGAATEVGYTEVSLVGAANKQHVTMVTAAGSSGQATGTTVTYTLAARSSAADGATIPGAATVTGGGSFTPKRIHLVVQVVRGS